MAQSDPRANAASPARRIGIFAKTFPGTTADAVLKAVAAAGIRHVQFNLSSLGLDTVPDVIPDRVFTEIVDALLQYHVSIDALSGTCNLAHPDQSVRTEWVRRLEALAALCAVIGIPVLTLTTGTRHPTDLWSPHPDNTTSAAWSDAKASLGDLMHRIRGLRVTLAFEPEPASITRSLVDAARMMAELETGRAWPRLGIVFDPANLVDASDPASLSRVLRDDVPKVAGKIQLMHAKDRTADGRVVPPGQGIIDFAACVDAAGRAGFAGPLIMHGLEASDVPAARAALLAALDRPH